MVVSIVVGWKVDWLQRNIRQASGMMKILHILIGVVILMYCIHLSELIVKSVPFTIIISH